jgi:multidrug efflux system membrane fusion protein
MKVAGMHKPTLTGRFVAAIALLLGVAAAYYAWYRTTRYPATDDASIDADVVHVAAPVGGRIVKLNVSENARVKKDEVLYEIDPVPYRQAVAAAQAELEVARAALDSRRRSIIGESSNAALASEQVRHAQQQYDLAARTVKRLSPLAAQGYVSKQQLDQAQTAERNAAVALTQANEKQRSSSQTIGSEDDAIAATHAREAGLAKAQHDLEQTTVRAPFDGQIAGLSVLAGETVAPGQSFFTLINTEEWFAVGNFRETALAPIKVGDCATVYSLIDRGRALKGEITGIGAGVADGDRVNLPRSLPYVAQSVNWVRVSKRFPVRVHLKDPPAQLVRVGVSAIVEVNHGASCR